jgi:hypothetical protein
MLGRFPSPDPIGIAGGINLYGYVGNDPLNWNDRAGLGNGGLEGVVPTPTQGLEAWSTTSPAPSSTPSATPTAPWPPFEMMPPSSKTPGFPDWEPPRLHSQDPLPPTPQGIPDPVTGLILTQTSVSGGSPGAMGGGPGSATIATQGALGGWLLAAIQAGAGDVGVSVGGIGGVGGPGAF